jgi:hypothetical protein
MITIQKVTSNVQSLLTRRTVFSKTVFSIARSTFRMYSVMVILKSSVVFYSFFVLQSSDTQRILITLYIIRFNIQIFYVPPTKYFRDVCRSQYKLGVISL